MMGFLLQRSFVRRISTDLRSRAQEGDAVFHNRNGVALVSIPPPN